MNYSSLAMVDVLVCTFRRPALLLKTLDGIERCAAKLGNVRIVIVDNDQAQSAREVVRHWALGAKAEVLYLSQPIQNISLSRNMALANATAPWIACIDDDEVPDEDWLISLLQTAESYEADVVFAPVVSEFHISAPAWAIEGTLFQRKRFDTGTVIPLKETRTSNVLLRTEMVANSAFRFDPALGLCGGEDSEFFARIAQANYRMVWCDEACVREWTPPNRTTLSWVLRRAFRIGSVEAYNRRRFRRYLDAGITGSKFFVFVVQGTLFMVFWLPFSSKRSVQAARRIALGAGYFYGLFAGPYLEYRVAVDRKESAA